MVSYKKKVLAALSAGTLFLSLASPAMADTSLVITGNGASSDNTVEVQTNHNTTVVQNNNAVVTNNVSANSSTGTNDANQNTNGGVLVKTGDATSNVTVQNMLNSNRAAVDCCTSNSASATISGNGANSDNKIELGDAHRRIEQTSGISVYQTNAAEVANAVDSNATTGKNDANQNTGGTVGVVTGDASNTVHVATVANENVAQVGGQGQGGDLSANILGNGAESDNKVELRLNNDVNLVQNNLAEVVNEVKADSKTGHNDTNQNTGGDSLVATGNASADVTVDNMVNFNWASVDCGCLQDLTAKIGGNGADTYNKIEYKPKTDLSVFQGVDSSALLSNDVGSNAKTGKNDLNQNNGGIGSDPALLTGDSNSSASVENTGNTNLYGVSLPEIPWDFQFQFDWSSLLGLLH